MDSKAYMVYVVANITNRQVERYYYHSKDKAMKEARRMADEMNVRQFQDASGDARFWIQGENPTNDIWVGVQELKFED